MQILSRPYGALHFRLDGPSGAPVVLMANSLGTDLRLWEAVLPLLPRPARRRTSSARCSPAPRD